MGSSSSSFLISSPSFPSLTLTTQTQSILNIINPMVPIHLSDHNFIPWRSQIETALRLVSLFPIVNGTQMCLDPEITDSKGLKSPNPNYSTWVHMDNMLLGFLTSHMTKSVYAHFVGYRHACDIWFAAHHRYSSLSRSHVHDLHSQLLATRKDTTMQAYLDNIKQISGKLAMTGSPIDEEEIVFQTLIPLSL